MSFSNVKFFSKILVSIVSDDSPVYGAQIWIVRCLSELNGMKIKCLRSVCQVTRVDR